VVVCRREGLPKDGDECWFLMRGLASSAQKLSDLYGRRITIAELFRDEKHPRQGWALRQTQIKRPERFDRLLRILTLAPAGDGMGGARRLWGRNVVQQEPRKKPVVYSSSAERCSADPN
jgi:hypothetical protein